MAPGDSQNLDGEMGDGQVTVRTESEVATTRWEIREMWKRKRSNGKMGHKRDVEAKM